jgi:predicted DNA-binding transcriptional regulator YafY
VACLVFLLLNWLLEAPRSMEELQALYQQHPWCARTPSDDTIRLYINTLKALGCQVQRPTKHTKKRYVLQAHPFTFPLFEAQEEAVIELLRPLETFELPEAMATLKFLNNLLQYAGVSPETTERFRNRLQLPHLQDTLSMVAQLERAEAGACPLFKVTYQAHAKQSKRQWVLWPLAVVAEAGRFYLMALEVAGADTASPTIPQERLLRLDRLLALAPLAAVPGQQPALQQAKQQFEATVPLLELKLRSCVLNNFRGFGLPGERWHTVEEPMEGANHSQGTPAAWQYSHYQVQTPFRFLLIQRVLASGVEILEASPSLFKEELCQWLTGMLGRYTASSFTPAERPEVPLPALAKRGPSSHAALVTPPPAPHWATTQSVGALQQQEQEVPRG